MVNSELNADSNGSLSDVARPYLYTGYDIYLIWEPCAISLRFRSGWASLCIGDSLKVALSGLYANEHFEVLCVQHRRLCSDCEMGIMDPNSSLGKICLGGNVIEILSDKVEGSGDWNSPEYKDTANSGGKKDIKAMVFHKMNTEEIKENMISNDYAVKLCLEHEVKRGNKVVKKDLIVALKGEIYFVKFIINPEEDDVEPRVILGRSFLRLTKAITDFKASIITIYPELDMFLEDSEEDEKNLKDSSDPTTAMNKSLALIAKAFKFNTIPTNNNQRSSLIPCNSQIAQPGMNTSQDIKMQMVDDNVGNQVRHNVVHDDGNGVGQNKYRNGNVVTTPAEGNGNGINGIQSTQEEFEFMTATDAHEDTERVKVNCTLEDTLQQASTYGTQSDNAPIYDSDGSTEGELFGNSRNSQCVLNDMLIEFLSNGYMDRHDNTPKADQHWFLKSYKAVKVSLPCASAIRNHFPNSLTLPTCPFPKSQLAKWTYLIGLSVKDQIIKKAQLKGRFVLIPLQKNHKRCTWNARVAIHVTFPFQSNGCDHFG
uniref:CMP/dCMP deaminase, zinc-binding n=1 Tax=Tanacetum cinerariifolium TaxID=118510 RepID=A0A6L2K394_TANCI|nr:CMP/dCMP deaminase, zinc-binding [Tanacetum cinerariifolium]